MRTKKRKERAQRQRIAQGMALRPNQRWSMDFVAQRLADGRWVRVLTVVDQFTRECMCLHADTTLSGEKVALALDKVVAERGAPESITVDNGTEFCSKAMDHWAYSNGVHLDFIRPGRPVENGYIESFNGKLRDECLNVEVFFSVADAREKLALWRDDYNDIRSHSALDDRTPADFAAAWAAWQATALRVPELAPEHFSHNQTLEQTFSRLSQFTAQIRCGHTFPSPYNQPKEITTALFAGVDFACLSDTLAHRIHQRCQQLAGSLRPPLQPAWSV